MNYTYQGNTFTIERYPTTENKSLKAWSAADEHILNFLEESKIATKKTVVYNDRFGFLSTFIAQNMPTVVLDFKSQEKAFELNFKTNELSFDVPTKSSIDPNKANYKLALLKIPKSLDLFRLQLSQIHGSLTENGQVVCGFMTKYFSKQYLSIASEFFEDCTQSKAWKKSRILILKKKRKIKKQTFLNEISYSSDKIFKQHYGVFSAKNIDYATQFFIDHMDVRMDHTKILDLAAGNGILAYAVQKEKPNSEIHVLEDSHLALESSKMNIEGTNVHFHYNDCLADFEDQSFDLIVSNPPFHFEHETNIEVALELFKEVKRCLKKGGSFQMVTSHHLNSKTHLYKLFHKVDIVSEDLKFVVYNCH
tara:strand:+ start:841 stop:1932 length:1092 start_codon:yes stop_codon:yes gene_type:complete